MGTALIKEAVKRNFEVVGAVEAPGKESVGKTLRQLGVCNLDLKIVDSNSLEEALENAEIYISFTTPEAEVVNLPIVAKKGKKVVVGTTGFNEEQKKIVENAVKGKVPAIFAANFSIGVNIMYKMLETCKMFPSSYDFSIIEAHHSGKVDAPSGTAIKLGEIVSKIRGYTRSVYGRRGISKRKETEMEILSVRAGGIPGIHDIIIAGQQEMIRIEHISFSRSAFAQGALYAAEWLNKQKEPKIYTMDDVLR
jgi:4-hydroxy-tetrahydrodipicolinate reductase